MRVDTKSQWLSFRLAIVYLSLIAFLGVVVLRLVKLQLLKNPVLASLAEKQFQKIDRKSAYRLPIWDRNHVELAVSVPSSSIFARPKLIKNRRQTAYLLSIYLGGEGWYKKLDPRKNFVWIKRQVSDEVAKKIEAKNIEGIFIEAENKRSYPSGMLASQLLGFTDVDGNGLSGLEFSLNEELLEQASKQKVLRDGKGNPTYFWDTFQKDSDKKGVTLTLDRRLQHLIEFELDKTLADTKAQKVLAAVMDAKTGEIYALAERPSFDPNNFGQYAKTRYQSSLVSSLYEPGSTFKTLFAAEAIEQQLLTPESKIDCEDGNFKIGNKRIREAEVSHNLGVIPLKDVIAFSSNIGAVKVIQKLGVAKAQALLEKFSFYEKLDLGLSGEAFMGQKKENFWQPFNVASLGFGQGISVTPLQMLASYTVFTNKGQYVKPTLFLQKQENTHRRLFSEETIKKMNSILIKVVSEGSGQNAKVAGVSVAGKTGTAQKYDPQKGYEGKKYFSSFLGYLPAEEPELLLGVWVDEPKNAYYGSQVAAPLFKKIAELSLQVLNKYPKLPEYAAAPDLKLTVKEETVAEAVAENTMPNLGGLSVREAIEKISKLNLPYKIVGEGYLNKQVPIPGSEIPKNKQVLLYFAPPS